MALRYTTLVPLHLALPMNAIRGHRYDSYALPTTGLAWLSLIAAFATARCLPHPEAFDETGFGTLLAHFTLATTAFLALACCAVLLVQVVQRRFNRTPLLPGFIVLYAAWVLARTLPVAKEHERLFPYTAQAMHYMSLAVHWILPAIGGLSILCALLMFLLRRPVLRQAWGYAQYYAADPDLIARRRPARPATRMSSNGDNNAETEPARQRTKGYPAAPPTVRFDDLHGNEALKQRLADAGRAWREHGSNGILLFGPPGTGKTVFAEALAGELDIGFMKVTFGDLASRWINQSTEQLVRIFDTAKAQQPVMLFIDEADALLKSRETPGNYEEYQRLVTTFLDQVVELRKTRVLVAAATNHIERLDEAAVREGRFDVRIEMPLPDAKARRGLIENRLATLHCCADADTMDRLVRRWNGFNVPRLLACADGAGGLAREQAGLPAHPGQPDTTPAVTVRYEHFYRALRTLQGRKGGAPEGAKSLSELFLDHDTSERLDHLATRLTNIDTIERMGGSLPRGVLFCGPPGTGKTATAMALARESGWSFIAHSGRDLLDHGAIDKLGREADQLRPVIVFIDEADDILGNREISPYKSATNELLILIDGAEGRLQDVVWIAATNHPENMDPAALRGGRFGQRINFSAPGDETLRRLVVNWASSAQGRQALGPGADANTWADAIVPILRGLVPSDLLQVLDSANNHAITDSLRHHRARTVTPAHVEQALAELRG